MREVTLYRSCLGVDNIRSPERLRLSSSGTVSLAEGTNIIIDVSGGIAARRGFIRMAEGNFHSMYQDSKDSFLVIQEFGAHAALLKAFFNQESGALNLVGLRSGLAPEQRVSFCRIGERIFYSNGYQNGVVFADISHPWPELYWTGPATSHEMTTLPVGKHIASFAGRILSAIKNQLYFSEYGLVGTYDPLSAVVRFASDIRLMVPTAHGVFVSDQYALYFLSGTNPREWQMEKVLDYPALENGTDGKLYRAMDLGIEALTGCVLMATIHGPVAGFADGTVINLINKKLRLQQDWSRGDLMVVDATTIIQTGV